MAHRFVLLLLLLTAACATPQQAPPSDPKPPARQALRSRDIWCLKLAESTLGATDARDVIQAIRISPRFDADEDTLAPLLDCATLLEKTRSPAARAMVRPLMHAYGLALVRSQALDDDEKRTLLDRARPPDVALFWRAQHALLRGAPDEALAHLDAPEAPSFTAARLLRALALARAGAADDALALAAPLAEVHPPFVAAVRAEVNEARSQPQEALAALRVVLAADPPAKVEDDPDLLALRSLPLPEPRAVHCRRGKLLEAKGEPAPALAAYREGRCSDELVAALLRTGRPFDALVALRREGRDDPATTRSALEALGRTRSLLRLVERQLEVCDRLQGGARCDAQRARADTLRAELTTPAHREPDFPGLLARLAEEDPPAAAADPPSADGDEADGDADDDGLHDDDEARLGVSARTADTDGDGVPDGEDGVPTSPGRTGDDDEATIVTGVLGHLLTGSADGLLLEDAAPLDGRVLFVASDVPPLAGARPPLRLAVLPHAGLRAYRARWGEPKNLVHLGEVVMAPERRRALVDWRWGFRAGTYLARLTDQGWNVWPVASAPAEAPRPESPVPSNDK